MTLRLFVNLHRCWYHHLVGDMSKPVNMLRTRRRDNNVKPNRRLDRKSSRGMIYENEELRLRTIHINAEIERGHSDIKKLRRENELLKREIWCLRDEYEKLDKLIQKQGIEICSSSTSSGSNPDMEHATQTIHEHAEFQRTVLSKIDQLTLDENKLPLSITDNPVLQADQTYPMHTVSTPAAFLSRPPSHSSLMQDTQDESNNTSNNITPVMSSADQTQQALSKPPPAVESTIMRPTENQTQSAGAHIKRQQKLTIARRSFLMRLRNERCSLSPNGSPPPNSNMLLTTTSSTVRASDDNENSDSGCPDLASLSGTPRQPSVDANAMERSVKARKVPWCACWGNGCI